jgi:hypothetical protein
MKRLLILLIALFSSTVVHAYNPTIEVTPATETNHQISFSVSVTLKSGTNWFVVIAPPEYKKHKLSSVTLVGGAEPVQLASVAYDSVALPDGKLRLVPKILPPKVNFPVAPGRFQTAKLAVRYATGPMTGSGITFLLDLKAYADTKRGTTNASTATNQPALRTD